MEFSIGLTIEDVYYRVLFVYSVNSTRIKYYGIKMLQHFLRLADSPYMILLAIDSFRRIFELNLTSFILKRMLLSDSNLFLISFLESFLLPTTGFTSF